MDALRDKVKLCLRDMFTSEKYIVFWTVLILLNYKKIDLKSCSTTYYLMLSKIKDL